MGARSTVPPPSRLAALGALGISLTSVVGCLYVAPWPAYQVRRPFLQRSRIESCDVLGKHVEQRSFETKDGARGHRERVVELQCAERRVVVEDLVLASDYEALEVGGVVRVASRFRSGAEDHGPFYLLERSVRAPWYSFLRWAFEGRPAYPGAVALFLLCVVSITVTVALGAPRRR